MEPFDELINKSRERQALERQANLDQDALRRSRALEEQERDTGYQTSVSREARAVAQAMASGRSVADDEMRAMPQKDLYEAITATRPRGGSGGMAGPAHNSPPSDRKIRQSQRRFEAATRDTFALWDLRRHWELKEANEPWDTVYYEHYYIDRVGRLFVGGRPPFSGADGRRLVGADPFQQSRGHLFARLEIVRSGLADFVARHDLRIEM